jgi:tripartite ATP-independent transporter DctM subunit
MALLMPVILLGGMLSGLFTATETAAVAVAYALVITLFVLRSINRRTLWHILTATALQSGTILLLVGAAVTFGWLVTVSGMAERIAGGLTSLSDDVLMLLFLFNVFLLLIGMFLDAGPAILILGPIMAPIFTAIGVDPVHFALIMCVNLTVGLITPPMGLVLFVTASVSGERIEPIIRAVLPFLAVEIAVIFLITYVPALTLALPRAFGLT